MQLQRQANRWAEHADVVALPQSVHRAGAVLTDLAGAEKDLAATLMRAAGHADPGRAAQLRRMADEALADARRADDRASSLRELAASAVERHHLPSGGA